LIYSKRSTQKTGKPAEKEAGRPIFGKKEALSHKPCLLGRRIKEVQLLLPKEGGRI
jgi:hypothetical protein